MILKPIVLSIVLLLAMLYGNAQPTDFSTINLQKADSMAGVYEGHNLKHPDKLAILLTKNLVTEVEKFGAIFYWITQNISYDYLLYLKDKKETKKLAYKKDKLRLWNIKFSHKAFTGVIKRGSTVCSGYSMLLNSMCTSVDIKCKTIEGYARTLENHSNKNVKINHAWNAVSLNGKWYLCDPTWASGSYDTEAMKFRKHFNKEYFLTDPSLLVANHFPIDTMWTLLYNKPSRAEFLNAPLKTRGYITNKINSYMPLQGVLKLKKCDIINFEFTSNEKRIASIVLSIDNEKKDKDLSYGVSKNGEGKYTINYMLDEAGKHIIDLYINYVHSFAYTVYVE